MAIGKVFYQDIIDDRQAYYNQDGQVIFNRLKKGRMEHNPFAYIAGSLGVTALVETSDCKFILGNRKDIALHPGGKLIHGISGYCEFSDGLSCKIDPYDDIIRELKEETRIDKRSIIQLKMLGLCFHEAKIGANFLFWLKIDIGSSYFMVDKLWQGAIDGDEHESFLAFTKNELSALLTNDCLHYSTRGAINEFLCISTH